MDPEAQTNESDTPKKPPPSRLYVLQVQAFLEAAEDVEIDPDTVEDILDGFEDVEISLEDQTDSDQDTLDKADEEDPNEISDDKSEDEAVFSELSAEAEAAWTRQEREQIIYYLQEHGIAAFMNQYVTIRQIPIPHLLCVFGVWLCPELREKSPKTLLYFLRVVVTQVLQRRKKIPSLNTIDDAVKLIHKSNQILILTGAGISVSCGIPDFRSRDGLYASLKDRTEYELDDPQQMFDIQYFREKPSLFYTFAREIYPSNFTPSPCHRFIKLIEDKDKLLRNYTQNIDTLETQAGVKSVLQCHGSFATATCVNCRQKVPGKSIEDDILNRRVPLCKLCNVAPATSGDDDNKTKKKKKRSGWHSDDSESDEPDIPDYPPGIMKPDITFFGEKLTDDFINALLQDRDKVDLIIIIGTSLKVSPVSEVISHLPHSVPQILINKTPIKHINPDIIMLGNADDIILHLCQKVGWELPSNNLLPPQSNMKKRSFSDLRDTTEPERVGNTHVWLFEGAEGGKWLQALAQDEREGPSNLGGRESKKVKIAQ